MLSLKKLSLKDILSIKRVLNSRSKDDEFYSPIKLNILKYIILKKCYYILKNGKVAALLLINLKFKEVYFVPIQAKGISFSNLIYVIKNKLPYKNLKLIIRYNKLDLIQHKKNLSYDIISNFKRMVYNLNCKFENDYDPSIKVRNMEINNEEHIRMKLQNEIFGGIKDRKDLTIDEIFYEEKSSKFIEELCFFCENEEPLGYGQIIFSDFKYTLVNFGIVPRYRNKGYAKILLNEIINKCYEYGIKKLYLTVDNNNIQAINLYKSIGFKELYNDVKILI